MVFRPTLLKNDGVKVSWDDDILNIWKNKIHVPYLDASENPMASGEMTFTAMAMEMIVNDG